MTDSYAVGVDLGGTTVRVALVDRTGHIHHEASHDSHVERGPEPVIEDMARWVGEVVAAAGVPRERIIGIGIGSPGPLSPSRGIVHKAANLPEWINVHLTRAMQRRTGLRTIMDNDANLAAYGEFWAGAGKDVDNMVMLTLGTGIGAGVVIRGELLHGHFENAGELGHWIVVPNGRRCSCGQRGCLEAYASAENVARRVAESIRNGEPSILSGLVEKGVPFGAREVVQAVQDGDSLASRLWDEACYYLAIACVNIQHAYNPTRIVMAGGMSKAGDVLTQLVQKHFELLAWDLYDDYPEIRIAVLGDDAGVIGAAGWAWKAEQEGRWAAEPAC